MTSSRPEDPSVAELRGPDSMDETDALPRALTPAPGYQEYLRLPALLALQKPLAQPPVHDEMLFIIVHQTHELWFKQILCELVMLIDDIDGGRIGAACRTLERIRKIARLLAENMELLGTTSAGEFDRFRPVLGTASGIESKQLHQLEQLAGRPPRVSRLRASTSPIDAPSASVREAFWRALATRESSRAEIGRSGVDVQVLGQALVPLLARPELAPQLGLAQAMLAFDEQVVLWRRHLELARAVLGGAPGTGGASGAGNLLATIESAFFPELWHWRTALRALEGTS